jgi:hypothetical protein
MKSRLLLSIIFASLIFTAHAYVPKNSSKAAFKLHNIEVNKFGPRVFVDGVNAFIEHKFTEQEGLQSGIGYKIYSAHSSFFGWKIYRKMFHYLHLPILFRFYLGETKGLCLFGGANLYYLLSTAYLITLTKDEELRKFNIGLSAGFDYETRFGFIWGLNMFELALLDAVKGPEPINLSRALSLVLGYNFAKLL